VQPVPCAEAGEALLGMARARDHDAQCGPLRADLERDGLGRRERHRQRAARAVGEGERERDPVGAGARGPRRLGDDRVAQILLGDDGLGERHELVAHRAVVQADTGVAHEPAPPARDGERERPQADPHLHGAAREADRVRGLLAGHRHPALLPREAAPPRDHP
jgi:hypothetical protein